MRKKTMTLTLIAFSAFCSALAVDVPINADLRIPPQIQESVFESNSDLIKSQSDQEDFRIMYNTEKILSFEKINKDANIRNLFSYLYSLYQKNLSPKIKMGNPLSDGEIMLLKYIIIGQLYTLDTFSNAFLADAVKDYASNKEMVFKSAPLDEYKDNNEKAIVELYEILSDLSSSYNSSSDPIRLQIKKYASIFSKIDPIVLRNDLTFMSKQQEEIINNIQWRSLLWDFTFLTDEDDYEKRSLRPYKELFSLDTFKDEANNIGNTWDALYPNCILHYSNALKLINRDIVRYSSLTTDAKSRTKIEDLRLLLSQPITDHLFISKLVFIDFPFCILTKYSFIHVQRSKRSWWDDDDQMQQIATLYAASIKGPAMLDLKFGSSFTASIYVQFIQLLKSEWSSKRYNSFIKASKLPERDPLEYVEENPI